MATTSKNALVWSQPNCVWCDRVKVMLISKGYTITEKMIITNQDKLDFTTAVPGARTVPQVFINGTYIGHPSKVREYLDA